MFGERELRMDGHRLQRKEAGESKGNSQGYLASMLSRKYE